MANATSGLALSTPDLLSARGAGVNGLGVFKAPTASLLANSFFSITNSYSGNYRVAGTTVDGGVPVKRNVFLFSQPSMIMLRSAATEFPACAFEFTNLAPGKYTVMGYDANAVQNSVVYSHVDAVV